MLRYTLYHDVINALSHRDKGYIATQYTLYRKITPCKSRRDRQKTPFSRSISSTLRDKLLHQKSGQSIRQWLLSLPEFGVTRPMGWNVNRYKPQPFEGVSPIGLGPHASLRVLWAELTTRRLACLPTAVAAFPPQRLAINPVKPLTPFIRSCEGVKQHIVRDMREQFHQFTVLLRERFHSVCNPAT